jgi:hypothetical protein
LDASGESGHFCVVKGESEHLCVVAGESEHLRAGVNAKMVTGEKEKKRDEMLIKMVNLDLHR